MPFHFRFAALAVAVVLVLQGGAAWAQVRKGSAEAKLFESVRNNDLAGVRASLDAGADVFATNPMGNRAADVAVDLSLFDIAHYLLSVMDHKRAVQEAKSPPVADVLLSAPPVQDAAPAQIAAPAPPPETKPAAKSIAKPSAKPTPQGPSPFEVTAPAAPQPQSKLEEILAAKDGTADRTSVDLAKPVVRMQASKPEPTPAEQASATAMLRTAPPTDPTSELHIKPEAEPLDVAPEAVPEPMPERDVGAPRPHAPRPHAPQSMPPVALTKDSAPDEPEQTSPPEPEALELAVENPPVEVAAKPQAEPEPAAEFAPAPAPAPKPISKSAPMSASAPQPAPRQEQGWFGKMTSFLMGGDAREETTGVKPEANQKPAQTVSIPLPAAALPPKPVRIQAAKRDRIQLTASLLLGKPQPVGNGGKDWACVDKGRWGDVCVEQARWADDLSQHLGDMQSNLYRGSKVVVAYENAQADFIYAVFPSESYDQVVAAFTQRLGAPDLISQRYVKAFQQQRKANPLRIWYGFDAEAGREMVLEIAKFDDGRGTFPKMDEGALKLTYFGEESVFRYTAPIELQRLN